MSDEPDFPMDRTIVKGLLNTRVQYDALLAALEALVTDMTRDSSVDTVREAEIRADERRHWCGRLELLLTWQREGQ